MADPLSCTAARELIGVASLDALEREGAPELARHLAGCSECRALARHDAAIADLLAGALTPQLPPSDLRMRLMSQVYAEAAASAPEPRPSLWQRLTGLIPASRSLTAGAMGVAVVAGALALYLGVHNHQAGAPAQPATLAYAIAGTTVDPGANGSVSYDPSAHRAVVTVDHLPQTTGNQVYELWLIPKNGNPVPEGLLSPQPSGDNTWTAVVLADVPQYSSLAATLEPAGGSPRPTGAQVVTSSLAG